MTFQHRECPYSEPEERLNFERVLFWSTTAALGERNEERARKAADRRWLGEGFEYGERVRAKGVLVMPFNATAEPKGSSRAASPCEPFS
jgi:hypothetical protein